MWVHFRYTRFDVAYVDAKTSQQLPFDVDGLAHYLTLQNCQLLNFLFALAPHNFMK